jgi:Flp pilus assembly protein protease CpaA
MSYFGFEIIFLIVLALIWIVFAAVQDLRTREIANWLNFSLVIFALGFRFFYSLFSESFGFFYQGIIGFGIFFVLGNLLYYGRFFAGGDAKLMISLGAVLPFSEIFSVNLKIFVLFFLLFLLVGGIYSIIASVYFSMRDFKKFKKEFGFQLKKNKRLIYPVLFFGLIIMLLGFLENILFFFGVLIFILPYFYIYTKAVDEACMIKKIKTSQLTEGDWLYKDAKIGNRIIKARWEGLKKEEIKQLRKKYKIILIRKGIPFSLVFFISFLFLIYFWAADLVGSLWEILGFV